MKIQPKLFASFLASLIGTGVFLSFSEFNSKVSATSFQETDDRCYDTETESCSVYGCPSCWSSLCTYGDTYNGCTNGTQGCYNCMYNCFMAMTGGACGGPKHMDTTNSIPGPSSEATPEEVRTHAFDH